MEQYILEFFKSESYLPAGIKNEMSSKFGLDEASSNDAIVCREWRIFAYCIENSEKFALSLGIQRENEQEEEEKKEEDTTITRIKEEVSQKANDKEKRDTWVEKMKEIEGKESMKN